MASILVLDDDDLVRDVLQNALEREGHQVLAARDGRKGLEIVRSQPVDLAIVDIIMPEKGGIETIMEIHREFPGLKTVVITGKVNVDLEPFIRLTRQFGVRQLIQKPFDLRDVLGTVRQILLS
jgi:DNA-binding NtrC family response regulator